MPTLEHRAGAELRAVDGCRRLEGYAAKFGTEARIGGFRETILPGAFAGSLKAGTDVLALCDHDMTRLLARRSSGTLRLGEDATGLNFSLDLPDTSAGRDIRELARRGDLGGMSFAFTVADGGDSWPQADLRQLRSVNLAEISVVQAHPAYPQTEVHARSQSRPVPAAVLRRRRMLVFA